MVMVKSKNPLLAEIKPKGRYEEFEVEEKANKEFITTKGFMSPTMNMFHLGVLTPGSWVAEDILLDHCE